MIKNFIYGMLAILLLVMNIGCIANNQIDNSKDSIGEKNNNLNSLNEEVSKVIALINDKEYIIALENNDTAKSFVNMLPQELKMSELNGNEKYVYLDNTLPTNALSLKKIKSGDVMLYGNNCLVIFYKSFDTSYSYTKIGHIDNLPDLGDGSISIKFKK